MYSVRTSLQEDFKGTLQQVKEMGYDGVEFASFYGKTLPEVKDMCKEIGLEPISAHVNFLEMMEDPDKVLSGYAELGCKFVAIPALRVEYRPGNEKFPELIEGIKMLGKKAKDYGMQLCYHNHDFEFEKINGEYGLDILYKEVPSDLLETELDICWVNVGGENPVDYINKYADRTTILHLKDFSGKKNEKTYALKNGNNKEVAEKPFEFRPVGYGLQNIPEVLSAAEKTGTEWVIVEQDEPSMGKSPMESAKMSVEYLKSL